MSNSTTSEDVDDPRRKTRRGVLYEVIIWGTKVIVVVSALCRCVLAGCSI